jgi:aspartate racemase
MSSTRLPTAAGDNLTLPAVRTMTGLIGVIGGMGPMATIDFMRKVMAATPAQTDQEHVPMLVSCIPQVPDRTAAFRGEGVSPLDCLIDHGRRLVDAGAGLLVMPCNTAHLWYDAVQAALGVEMIHLVDAALDDAQALVAADARVGLLGTDATLASGLYVNRSRAAGRTQALQWLQPTAREMIDWVLPGIAAVKAADLSAGQALLGRAACALESRGAAALVLGCTEIPLALGAGATSLPLIDPTASLARHVVQWSMARRKNLHVVGAQEGTTWASRAR